MLTKVQKWGNSLGLRIPRSFAADARVEPGSVVDISLVRGGLMVRAARPRRYRLDDLLKGVSSRNLHEEVHFGDPVGREAW
jgi:antitoxin MazE